MPFNPFLNPLLTQQFAAIPQMQNPYLQYGQMPPFTSMPQQNFQQNIQQAMLPFQQAFQPFQPSALATNQQQSPLSQPFNEQMSQSSQQIRRQSQHDVDMQQQPQLES
jgi:hypothetical protein